MILLPSGAHKKKPDNRSFEIAQEELGTLTKPQVDLGGWVRRTPLGLGCELRNIPSCSQLTS